MSKLRGAYVISLRVIRGFFVLALAVGVIAWVSLVPPPKVSLQPLTVNITPDPAPQLLLCPGAFLRLGDEMGDNAGESFPIGFPNLTEVSEADSAVREALTLGETGTGGSDQAPQSLRSAPATTARIAGASTQTVASSAEAWGMSASACRPPASSAWLVAGSTEIGHNSLLLLNNPNEVVSLVTLRMWGEDGEVVSAGMSGITVPPGAQRVFSLAAFAPDLASPVVNIQVRGGWVAASLQHSVIRGIKPGGMDLVEAIGEPQTLTVIPAVRITGSAEVVTSLGIAGYQDLPTVMRIGNPGEQNASVEVSVVSATGDGAVFSFVTDVPADTVSDVPLLVALGRVGNPLPDGVYSLVLRSSVPVVAGVRVATATAPLSDGEALTAGDTDIAWFAGAAPLGQDTVFAAANAPSPVLVVTNASDTTRMVTINPLAGGDPFILEVAPFASAASPLAGARGYRLQDAEGLYAGLSFAAPGFLSGYTISPHSTVDPPLVVYP